MSPRFTRDPGGPPIHEDPKYGVGTIIAARFDEPIAEGRGRAHPARHDQPAGQGVVVWGI